MRRNHSPGGRQPGHGPFGRALALQVETDGSLGDGSEGRPRVTQRRWPPPCVHDLTTMNEEAAPPTVEGADPIASVEPLRSARTARLALAFLLLALVADRALGQEQQRRPRIALVLGGGSARGFAHAGVLQWLEEHHVPIDAIAGTSSGAFIGGAYATGMSAAELQEMLRSADWDLLLRPDLPYPLKSFRRKQDDRDYPVKLDAGLRHGFRLQSGLSPGHQIGLLLSRVAFPYSTVENFDDLAIPFRCVATDLERGETIVLDRGPLGPALRASMALPGTFDPVRLSGRLLSDGGILDNIPVDVARAMGADIVIAVKVGDLERVRPPETMSAVANRAIDLMMRDLERPRLEQADLVIVPDFDGFRSSDFRKSEAISARGYAAAAAQSETLLRYALDPEAWAKHISALRDREHPSNGPLSFVEVTGVAPQVADEIAHRLEQGLAETADTKIIEAELNSVIGLGRYASAMYDRRRHGEKEGLGVEIRDKSYAPPFVRFSLDLDNENKDVNLSLGSRITFMDVTGSGSEWRVDTSVGSCLRFSTELLQPLRGRSALRRGAFVAPRVLYARTNENLYEDGELAALYTRQRMGAGLDVGWVFGRSAQLRTGYEAAYVKNVTRVGDLLPRTSGNEQRAHVSFEYDRLDRAYFSSRGFHFTSTTAWYLRAPEAAHAFGRAEATLNAAWPIARRHHASFYADIGTTFGETPPVLYEFTLGGPFRLGAFPPNAFRGESLLLGGASCRTVLGRLPRLLGDRLYLKGLLEIGTVFDRLSNARVKSSFTVGLAADTFFGPVFAGASIGNGGTVRAYFIVGTAVR